MAKELPKTILRTLRAGSSAIRQGTLHHTTREYHLPHINGSFLTEETHKSQDKFHSALRNLSERAPQETPSSHTVDPRMATIRGVYASTFEAVKASLAEIPEAEQKKVSLASIATTVRANVTAGCKVATAYANPAAAHHIESRNMQIGGDNTSLFGINPTVAVDPMRLITKNIFEGKATTHQELWQKLAQSATRTGGGDIVPEYCKNHAAIVAAEVSKQIAALPTEKKTFAAMLDIVEAINKPYVESHPEISPTVSNIYKSLKESISPEASQHTASEAVMSAHAIASSTLYEKLGKITSVDVSQVAESMTKGHAVSGVKNLSIQESINQMTAAQEDINHREGKSFSKDAFLAELKENTKTQAAAIENGNKILINEINNHTKNFVRHNLKEINTLSPEVMGEKISQAAASSNKMFTKSEQQELNDFCKSKPLHQLPSTPGQAAALAAQGMKNMQDIASAFTESGARKESIVDKSATLPRNTQVGTSTTIPGR